MLKESLVGEKLLVTFFKDHSWAKTSLIFSLNDLGTNMLIKFADNEVGRYHECRVRVEYHTRRTGILEIGEISATQR